MEPSPPDLLPRTVLKFRLGAVRWRSGLLFGVAWSVAVFTTMVILGEIRLHGVRSFLALAIFVVIAAIVGGCLWAIGFPLLFRRSMRRALEKCWSQTPPFDAPPPAGATFDRRLLCAHFVGPGVAPGGVLYLGRGSCVFVAHGANAKWSRTTVVLPAAHDLEAAVVPQPDRRNAIQRFLAPGPLAPLLRLSNGSASWDFGADEPDLAAEKIRSLCDMGRRNPSSQAH